MTLIISPRAVIERIIPSHLLPYWNRLKASPLGYRLARGAFWSFSGTIVARSLALLASVLVMRETTERPEAIEAGTATLVGTDSTKIVQSVLRILDDLDLHRHIACIANPYGDGLAAGRITGRAISFLSE